MAKSNTQKSNASSATIGFEAKLWLAADKLRNNMDAAEYKHVVLGLIFLKYISDTFEDHRAKLVAGKGEYKGANPEDQDEYKAENVFWVPPAARWAYLQGSAKQPTIGKIVDDAMVAIERDNPPFNDSDWFRKDDDVRWLYGVPPKGNANFAWVQHFIHHLAPHGMAGFVLANGSMSSNQTGEGDIRKAIVEADLVDCMVAMPGQLFYSTQIPVCLWFLAKNRKGVAGARAMRKRQGETLFIDARKMGTLIDRVHRELTAADLQKITTTYHAWREDAQSPVSGSKPPVYSDVPGFCKSSTTAEIAAHGHVLTPGRYVGAEEVADDGEPFEEKMRRLVAELRDQFAESAKMKKAIRANLKGLGYDL